MFTQELVVPWALRLAILGGETEAATQTFASLHFRGKREQRDPTLTGALSPGLRCHLGWCRPLACQDQGHVIDILGTQHPSQPNARRACPPLAAADGGRASVTSLRRAGVGKRAARARRQRAKCGKPARASSSS